MIKKYIWIILLLIGLLPAASCSRALSSPQAPSAPAPSPQVSATDAPEKDSTLRFVVMADCRGSDNGINTEIVKKTLQNITKLTPQPQFAVMPGDLIGGADSYAEEKAELQYFKDTVTQYYPAAFYYPGFGNHETSAQEGGTLAFDEVFPEFKAYLLPGYRKTVYYFDRGQARFYMLNSNFPGENHMVSDAQLNWLRNNSDPSKIYHLYFLHDPAYPTGAHVGSSLDVNRLQRDKLWEVIDHSVNPMVFCGHEHNYSRRHIDSAFNETVGGQSFAFSQSVYQVTTGTFGAPVYTAYTDKKNVDVPPISQYHFAVVDLSNGKIQVTTYNLDGKVIDRFEQ